MLHNRKTTPLRTILENCLTHIEKLEANRSVSDCYEKEFQDLKQFSESLKGQIEYACTEGEKEVNRKKNRYKDILPFNGSRVILTEVPGVPGSNYVNANYIKGASGSPAYIASQGPLTNTVIDFWRMVVECEVQVIVMACNAEEAGKHKCENYWVERESEPRTFGSVEISLIKANIICADFLVRTMLLKYTNDKGNIEERTVCQFHYSAWPDHGVPPFVRPLLDMVRLVRDTQASETLPVLVHCSAGCGRTGTICAIDFVWGLLRLGKLSADFSLFNLVRDMRKQRVAMVQTKEQYILVHQAVRELFKEQLQIIESHHYENVSSRGEPLVSESEPIYETLSQVTVNGEKQDWTEIEKSEQSSLELSKKSAPPLPRKKCASIPSSKQEKEVENLTQKNRITVQMNDSITSENSPETGRRPKMTKLKALFDRGTPSLERQKPRNHTISRSHSLGPVRKPMLSEVLKTPEVKKTRDELPIRSGGKLKVPKLISPNPVLPKPVAQIKRSKSLKVTKESIPLLTLINYTNIEDLKPDLPPSRTITRQKTEIHTSRKHEHFEQSRRRRSLESLLGEESNEMSWSPWMSANANKQVEKTKPGLSLRHQFQLLSHVSQKTMNSLASGLGIRERRNSFRQAVSKQDSLDRVGSQFGSEGRFVSVPEDSGASVLVDGSYKPQKDALTVRSQNGEILGPLIDKKWDEKGHQQHWVDGKEPRISASASLRLPAKNRFLYRLKTELQTNNYSTPTQEANHYSTVKSSPQKKVEPTNQFSPIPSRTPPQKPVETNLYSTIPMKNSRSEITNIYATIASKSPQIVKGSDVTDGRQNFKTVVTKPSLEGSKKPLSRTANIDISRDYIKNRSPQRQLSPHGDLYGSYYPRSGYLVQRVGKSSSASSQSSDNLSDCPKKSPLLLGNKSSGSHRGAEVESESSSSSGARELFTVLRPMDKLKPDKRDVIWNAMSRSKSTSQVIEEIRSQPVAPPRIRRRISAGGTVARHSSIDLLEHSSSSWSMPSARNINDNSEWCGALGVDLDAVAASMQRTTHSHPSIRRSVLSDSEMTPSPPPVSLKKQQYL